MHAMTFLTLNRQESLMVGRETTKADFGKSAPSIELLTCLFVCLNVCFSRPTIRLLWSLFKVIHAMGALIIT